MTNKKNTSKEIASKAGSILQDSNASAIQKQLAGSALNQIQKGHQPSEEVQAKAGMVLQSEKYSEDTKALAASIVAQSPK